MLHFLLITLVLPFFNLALQTPVTDPWVLAAHGSTRFTYKGTDEPYTKTITPQYSNLQFPIYKAVIGLTPDGAGGMIQRASDGHIHLQVVGPSYMIPSSAPYGPQCDVYPPYVFELDGDTADIIRVYNLSAYGKFFTHPLRYTPDGHVIATVFKNSADYFNSNSHTILILDKNSDKIVWRYQAPEPPHLLSMANTNPPTLIFSSAAKIASLTFTSTGYPDPATYAATTQDSTIIFGTDGKTLYNDVLGEPNEPLGIWKLTPELPLRNDSKAVLVIPGCYSYPWLMAFDTQGATYAVCYRGWKLPIDPYDQKPHYVTKFDGNGTEVWRVYQMTARFVTVTDDENIVFVGNENEVLGYDTAKGVIRWRVTPMSFIKGREDSVLSMECMYGANPWSPRHPIALASGRIAFLCSNNGGFEINVIDGLSGEVVQTGIRTIIPYRMGITADGNDNVYVYGFANISAPVATVQRVHLL